VLAGALASALGLVAISSLSSVGWAGGDPALAGEATLARLAGEVADGVVDEWERLRAGDEELLSGERFTWSVEPVPAPRAPLEPGAPGSELLAALLAESVRLEGEPERAAAALTGAERHAADATDAARLALRRIQLARTRGDDEEACRLWRAASADLDPARVLGETSALLVLTLAAGPALELVERARTRDRLSELWTRGELPLPRESAGELAESLRQPAPLAAELRRRLQALVPEADPDPALERLALAERARLLASAFGEVPAPAGSALELRANATHELVFRAAPGGTAEGVLLPAGTMRARLEARLATRGLLPPDFALDFDGSAPGVLVREPTALQGAPLAFALRHADPGRVTSAVAQRQTRLRAAIRVLALFSAAAGVATFRALVRERRAAATKSAFVANVSHELRTPIASILLLAENLERGKIGEENERRRYHGLIRREAERLRGLVEDVLDLARLERGEAPPWRRAPVATRALVAELEQAARERVAAAGGALDVTTRALSDEIEVDAEAVRRALLNLIENALLHSGSLELELSVAGDGAGGLVLALRDHGRGVPPEARARIFEPFERLEHVDAAPGTGLGLAIVREVALAHGGSARVRAPESGPGAVFELHLAAREATA